MAEDDMLGFLLLTQAAASKQATITKDLKQKDCEIVYQEWVSLDRERAKRFLQLYSKPNEQATNEAEEEEKIGKLTENSCMAFIVKKKQLLETFKELFDGQTSMDKGDLEASSFSTKYGFPFELLYYSTDKSIAKECIEFFFPNLDIHNMLENNPRKYLESAVVPILTAGLTQLCKLEQKPENPCEWLGHYLIQHDPTLSPKKKVYFILGGPGSGKAGDLLRKEMQTGSSNGQMIDRMIRNGEIVPGHITIELLKNAMEEQTQTPGFLIDGFPRKLDQAGAFEKWVGDFEFILFLDCPQEEMEQRLMKRGQMSGRSDDNLDSIRKRFTTFVETTMPVVEYYRSREKLVQVDASRSVEEVYKDVRSYFIEST
ncbi:Uridylate kinase [Galdieria sulphuraria]|nr:Uridylate kinase [Galdieria sulphuraria]